MLFFVYKGFLYCILRFSSNIIAKLCLIGHDASQKLLAPNGSWCAALQDEITIGTLNEFGAVIGNWEIRTSGAWKWPIADILSEDKTNRALL